MTASDTGAWTLLVFMLLAFLPTVGAVAAPPGDWYAQLRKPPLNPPNWVFGPVWTVLYLLIGVSAWLVWQQAEPGTRALPMGILALNLLCNGLWSWLFFGLHRPDLALADLVVLWATIVAMIWAYARIHPLAAGLQVPYLLWVSFAGYLNYMLWQLNR